jgi:hypothetical protein
MLLALSPHPYVIALPDFILTPLCGTPFVQLIVSPYVTPNFIVTPLCDTPLYCDSCVTPFLFHFIVTPYVTPNFTVTPV